MSGLAVGLAWLGSSATAATAEAPGILHNQFGQAVPASQLSGKVLLVYFGYTSCPELCPNSLNVIGRALQLLGRQGDAVLPLFVTVDPRTDTPAVMRRYLRHFHPRIVGLTGSPAAVAEAARSFNVQFTRGSASGGDSRSVDHGVLIYLTDRRGAVVGALLPGQPPQQLADAVRDVLKAVPAARPK